MNMLLTKEEIKQQTRELWQACFTDTEDFLDIYFDEKYSDSCNHTLRADGRVVAATQALPYRMTFYGTVAHAAYISGLCTLEQCRKRGLASQLLRDTHRSLYEQGTMLSFLIPGNEDLRHFYEANNHGAYWTATYRKEIEIPETDGYDAKVEITQPDDWGDDLYVFYRQRTSGQPFMLHPAKNDFYAALASCDSEEGMVLVARRKHRLLGVCLAVVEKDGRCFLRSLLSVDEKVKDCFLHYLKERLSCDHVYSRIPVPGSAKEAVPYAMARVIHVEEFLKRVVSIFPALEMHIGVDGDLDIPENNGYYWLQDGKVTITDEVPDSIVTPGGLAALFLAANPTTMEMMLDE